MYRKGTTLALSCLALVAILGSTSHANVVSFSPAQTYTPLGVEPTSVAVGDLDGDGKADMVVTAGIGGSGNQGEVTVFLGKGDGTFTRFTGFDSGAGFPTSVIIADLNRDGKPDLIVLNCDDGSKPPGTCADGTHSFLAIFRGNGNGTFQSPQTYDLGEAGGCFEAGVTAADLNGDGDLDLVACTNVGVAVLLGNGDLTFQSTVAYNGNGYFVSLADMNGDGKLDILLTFSLQIRFLLGNGDGTFHLSPLHLDGGGLTQVSVGDVNEDGITDIVTESDNGLLNGMVHVFLGNGDLTFQPETRFHSGGAYLATSLTVADVNADDKPDIVVSSCGAKRVFCGPSDGGVVSILAGRGTGEFKQAVTYPSGGAFADFATVADVNGDSRPDLVVTDFFTNDVGVLLNTGLYPTSTSLNSSMNPSRQGQAVTFTATVAWVGPTPTGKVTFKIDGAWLGAAMLSGGVATVTKHLTVGTHSIVARYHGDGVAAGQSTSSVLIQVVNP